MIYVDGSKGIVRPSLAGTDKLLNLSGEKRKKGIAYGNELRERDLILDPSYWDSYSGDSGPQHLSLRGT